MNKKIKVFFDTGPLKTGHAVRGIGVYTRNLIDALGKINDVELVENINNADIIHYSYFDLFFNTLNIINKPTVITIFDTIPLIYPKHFPLGIKGKLSFWSQKRKLKNSQAIITISETSKKDIIRFLEVVPDKIHVIHLAPGKYFKKVLDKKWKNEIKEKYNLPDEFVLYVGDVNYNKNIINLIKASKIINLPLVICGKQAINIEKETVFSNFSRPRDWLRYLFGLPHPELVHLQELVKELQRGKDIIRLGFISDEDLVGVYNLATVYCQPSFYEGFGIPILEAMKCGCPVVAAKIQALVEISGAWSFGLTEDAALFVDPKDPKKIAAGLEKVINNQLIKNKLIKDGLKRVKTFSWDKTAKKTIEIYKQSLNK